MRERDGKILDAEKNVTESTGERFGRSHCVGERKDGVRMWIYLEIEGYNLVVFTPNRWFLSESVE